MYYLDALCLMHILSYTPNIWAVGFRPLLKVNELSSVMTVCIYGFHNDVMTYMLQIGESTIHKIFGA